MIQHGGQEQKSCQMHFFFIMLYRNLTHFIQMHEGNHKKSYKSAISMVLK